MDRRRLIGVLAAAGVALAVVAGGFFAIRSWTVNDRDRVRTVVEQYGAAVANKAYPTICQDLLGQNLRKSMATVGLPCEQGLRTALAEVQKPTLRITSVAVAGDKGSVGFVSGAEGQQPYADVIQLAKESGSWRIVALGSAATSAKTTTGTSTAGNTAGQGTGGSNAVTITEKAGAPAAGGLAADGIRLPGVSAAISQIRSSLAKEAGISLEGSDSKITGDSLAERRKQREQRRRERRAIEIQSNRGR